MKMAWGMRKSNLFEQITPASAESVILSIGKAWYVLAVLQGLIYGALAYFGKGPISDLIDPVFCLIGGYFLRGRRSRSLAIVLLLYALACLAITLQSRFGNGGGGRNVWLAFFVVIVGVRGVQATWVYHEGLGSRTIWRRVIGVYAATVLASALVLFAGLVAYYAAMEIWPGFSLAEDILGSAIIGLPISTVAGFMALLTRRYPFTMRPAAAQPALGGIDPAREVPSP
jgi:hypothetical protein